MNSRITLGYAQCRAPTAGWESRIGFVNSTLLTRFRRSRTTQCTFAVCMLVLCGSTGRADFFLDLTSVTPGGPGLGAFSGTLGGIAVTATVAGSPSVFSINPLASGISGSTIAGTSPQYSYSSVYGPTIGTTDQVGYSYLGGATNSVVMTFAAPITDPVFHVANLDVTQISFASLSGLTSLTLLNGNGGGDGDGLAVIGGPSFSIVDANPFTSDATLPTSSPPTTGFRSAYGSVRLNGTFTTIGFGIGASGPGADFGGGSFTLSISSVPEPSSLILAGLGALGVVALATKRFVPDRGRSRPLRSFRSPGN